MSYRGYFREKEGDRRVRFKMRHKGSLMIENDEIVFMGRGDNITIKYNEFKSIKLLKNRSFVEFKTNNGIIYVYMSLGDAGVSAQARQSGNMLFGVEGGNALGMVANNRAIKRINEEIYKMIDYRRNKLRGSLQDDKI